MLKFVHLFNNSPFLSSFMSYQGFCSQFLSLIQFTFNRTCLFVSVTKYNPVYLNYMFEMPFQEISRLKNQTHIDLTTEEFLPFVMKSNKREDSGSQNPDKIPSSFGLQEITPPTYTPSFNENTIIYSKMISFYKW